MGMCYGKNISVAEDGGGGAQRRTPLHPANGRVSEGTVTPRKGSAPTTPVHPSSTTPAGGATPSVNAWPSPFPQGSGSPLPPGVSPSPAQSTPRRIFRRPFPPPSPAKHIKAALAKRQGQARPKEGPIPEEATGEADRPLDKSFGYSKNFGAKYEVGKEVGRGHFGHTCSATAKKREIKGQIVAVKIISKAKT